ncbi:hypothetical protein B9Z55_021464 [Caenorhabditis nigoni]|uniref:Uncharacterized protein n=1 Tax=Caenorhabditis nigoni TaxID=1611254 RepID=A0A2G5TS77_9PELO|nr:hypothetical protein B9Z55_021464 [Caenorhabditis nigoni]
MGGTDQMEGLGGRENEGQDDEIEFSDLLANTEAQNQNQSPEKQSRSNRKQVVKGCERCQAEENRFEKRILARWTTIWQCHSLKTRHALPAFLGRSKLYSGISSAPARLLRSARYLPELNIELNKDSTKDPILIYENPRTL